SSLCQALHCVLNSGRSHDEIALPRLQSAWASVALCGCFFGMALFGAHPARAGFAPRRKKETVGDASGPRPLDLAACRLGGRVPHGRALSQVTSTFAPGTQSAPHLCFGLA